LLIVVALDFGRRKVAGAFWKGKDCIQEDIMCYNCGCEMPDNDMGNPKNITNKTFEEAAKAMEQSVEEAKRFTLELLKSELEAEKK
jgi:hypothetical protein